jgi:2-keto-4-pentenoate hydratase/2-oxohepta-3-ene-1,7-dioic acid hydratase in catechol pathway
MTNQGVTRYVRYTKDGQTSYGVLEGDTVHQLSGDLFENPTRTGVTARASEVKFEIPVDPDRVQKVIGLTAQFSDVKKPAPHLRLFGMFATSLLPNGGEIEVPPECHFIHHEGEMVVVIGKKVPRFTSVQDAPQYVFGVTVGNDVADSSWYGEQKGPDDPSRLIAKAPDTWAPIHEQIVVGLNYDDLQMKARLNGVQAFDVRTSQMNNSVAETIAYLSEYMTLMPGDLLYMGTPNLTRDLLEMHVGDTVEIELEGVGILRNKVVAMNALPLHLPAMTPPAPMPQA